MKRIMRNSLLILAALSTAATASAKIKTEAVQYKEGETVLEGYLAYDDALSGNRPAVLVVHEWWGLNDYPKHRAEQLAQLGYVAFACDIYGKGVVATSPDSARAYAGKFWADRALLRRRAQAGLDVLLKQKNVDSKRVAAIGYCFGGLTVLELARSGANVAGVVSFHGVLNTPNAEDAKNIKGKVLVLHGGDDPNVPPEQVQGFMKEMRDAGVDWQFVAYGGAVHAFTNPAAGNDPSKGAAYNASADKRSWEAMQAFFKEIFK
jgi:dienelactone hydrolase